MTPQLWLLVGTIFASLCTLLGTWLLVRQKGRQAKTTDAQALIDQLQEMNAAAEQKHREEMAALERRHRTEMAGLERRVQGLNDRVVGMEEREFVLLDYAYRLRAHIDARRDPPPPAWPPELLHRLKRGRAAGPADEPPVEGSTS